MTYPFNREGALAFARSLGIVRASLFGGTWSCPAPRSRPGRRKARRMAARGY
jgi:hypothetical protein